MAKAKNGRVGIFEDSDGIISVPKVQAVAFTATLIIMIFANTFFDYESSLESWTIAAIGAGLGVVDVANDRKKTVKMQDILKKDSPDDKS